MPHGIRNPDREADCRSRRRGRAAEPGQDDPGAAGVLDLDPGPETGTGPQGASSGPDPRQAAMPGYAAADPARRSPGRQGAGGCGGPERPSPCFGITLSDEGGPEERARTRRSARLPRSTAVFTGPPILIALSTWLIGIRGADKVSSRSGSRCPELGRRRGCSFRYSKLDRVSGRP
jgi:hypothetical protein